MADCYGGDDRWRRRQAFSTDEPEQGRDSNGGKDFEKRAFIRRQWRTDIHRMGIILDRRHIFVIL